MKIYDFNMLIDDKLETKQFQAKSFKQAVKYALIDYPNAVILKDNVSIQIWGKNEHYGNEFATHKFSFQNGKLNKYWGHYIRDAEKAIDDFISRIND